MGLRRVKGMPGQPGCCTICGGNPAEQDGSQREAIWAEGVDIDWGNDLYICWDCAELIADLIHRVDTEAFDKLTAKNEELTSELEELQEKYEHQQELLVKVREGASARRRLREGAAT